MSRRCNGSRSGFDAAKRFSIGHMKNRMLVFASALVPLNMALIHESIGSNKVAVAFVRAPDDPLGRTAGSGCGGLGYRGTHTVQLEQANEQGSATLEQSSSLAVNIADAKHDDGSAGVALWNGPEGFPEEIEHAIRIAYVPVVAGVAAALFEDLTPGRYAVTVYNDRNGNETFDKNWIGMPRESWGVSNNARPRLRAPGYGEAAFDLDAGAHRLEIELR